MACLFGTMVHAAGINPEQQSITISLSTEPPSLDSSLSEDVVSAFVLSAINEGLVRSERNSKIIPGVAEKWRVDGSQAYFWLRKDAKWSDGSVVTAHDFVYSWRRLFDPKTGASGSTFFAYVFKNGLEILAGKKPPKSLGVNAVDDHTLQVILSRSIPYLLEVLLGTAYFPLKQTFVEEQGDRYGSEANRILFNAPYQLTSWQHAASLTLSKNPMYWGKEGIMLEGIDVDYITSDTRSLLNLYLSKEIASLDLDENTLKDAGNSGLRLRQHPTSCVTMLTLNTRPGRVTSNKNIRKALQSVFDADIYVRKVIAIPANKPAYSVFTRHLKGAEKRFSQEYQPQKPIISREVASRYMAAARKELGDNLPTLTLLTAEGAEKRAEYLQGLFGGVLGLDVKIDKQTFKQSIVKLIGGDFDIAQSGFCSGTLRDPAFFARIFESTGTFNDGRFVNAEYDQLLEETQSTTDAARRMKAFGGMQDILFEEVAILPTHENGQIYVQDNRLTNVQRFPAVSYTQARLKP